MKLALGAIALAVPAAEREWILGDVQESFESIAAARGRAAANRWLWGETLRILYGAAALRRAHRRALFHRRPPPIAGDSLMRTLVHDTRYALRLLGRSPGFAVIAGLTLAVGIGANVTVFSVVRGVLMKPLPYENPDRLVRVFEDAPRSPKWP